EVTLLQRKPGKLGEGLGKTTGWIHRAALKMKRVRMIGGVNYERIGAYTEGNTQGWGLLVSHGEKRENPTWMACDTVVLCAGQLPLRTLADDLRARGQKPHLIGGALEAGELDAKRAIDQAARLAARLCRRRPSSDGNR
ncbi:MAG: NADPH-dependent 2,4-dienoyl-CoA reductase, partial [Curvibacter sp.]